ncbi:MAG TPA: S8 family serine peptidase [Candidatus Thermoplasmatota archaeon]|nr:S8 family serine peptidase [Candidatus Thermoplasmatota archaeon]
MVALHRAFTLIVAAGLIITLFPSAAPVAQAEAPLWTITGPGAADAVGALGGKVQDNYGAFVTARAPPALAEQWRVQGFAVAAVGATTGRGSYHFAPAAGDGLVPSEWRSDDSAFSLVAFRGPVKQAWRDALLAQADIYDYLPFNSFVVRGDRAALARLEGVQFVGAYHAGYKLAPELSQAQGAVKVTALTFPDADLAQAADAVAATGATITTVALIPDLDGILKLETDAANLRAIAQVDAINWIEPSLDGPGLDNDRATGIVQSGDSLSRSVNNKGVDGSSQVVSICDTGVETVGTGTVKTMRHEMFNDPANPSVTYQTVNPLHRKVLLYYSPIESGVTKGDFVGGSHGTHTAGTIAGDAPAYNVANNRDSGAYAAKLAICSLGNSIQIPNDYATMWDPAYAVGARINSNSWGQPHNNQYNALARQQDAYSWSHRDFSIIRSAGNTGPGGQIRPEAIAKDVLAVASSVNEPSGNPESLSGFSSRGPSADGRVKPDITAPGECLNSANFGTSNGYACLSGTSMSTPTTSAAAALVRDYFAKGFYPGGAVGSGPAINPSNALVRATLFASGYEMKGVGSHQGIYHPATAYVLGTAIPAQALAQVYGSGISNLPTTPVSTTPNGNIGWGRIQLDSALAFAGDPRGLFVADEDAGLATGGAETFTVTVADGAEPLRIMLVWTDQPGAAGALPSLVNNLDLSVVGPDGTAYQGNNFLGHTSIPGGIPDLNNVAESVALDGPATGEYTIVVTGTNVPDGPQPFALVVVGALA